MRIFILGLLALIALPAAAETCAPGPDRSAEHAALFQTLRDASDQAAGERAADEIWRFWLIAPDERSKTLLSAAINHLGEGLPESALSTLDALIEYCPSYAEAWNQRATLHFMLGDFAASLTDVEHVLELEPLHFGALAGKGIMLMQMGEIDLGQRALRRAVEIHPWLRERRSLLPPAGIDL